jgi:hypothetical protein
MACRRSSLVLGLLLLGCGPKGEAKSAVNVPPPPATAPPIAAPTAEPPLPLATPEEQEVAGRLRATVVHLAAEVGERNLDKSWNLATATDDLARTLEKMGYEVQRQGFVVGDAPVQNLEVRVPGGEQGGQAVVVGAHYDTRAGTPGADGDASGVAAIIELARAFRDKRLKRTVRLALFANGEEPHFQTEQMGSRVYAKDLVVRGIPVTGMVSIDGIGAYSTAPGSQHFPKELASHYPATASFVAVVGTEASRALVDQVTASMKQHATLPVVGDVVAQEIPFGSASDHWAFASLGTPALMITDTAAFRYAHYRQKTDLPAELDFDRMARVVVGLRKAIEDLAGGPAGSATIGN